MAYWKLFDETNPFKSDGQYMSDNEMDRLWKEFKNYNGSHRQFFLERVKKHEQN